MPNENGAITAQQADPTTDPITPAQTNPVDSGTGETTAANPAEKTYSRFWSSDILTGS